MQLRVLSGTDVRTYSCEGGENLLTFLQGKGYAIAASCGGNGKCGKCKVRVLEGGVEGQENGYAYACLAHISRDAYVEVFETKGSGLTRSFVQDSKTDGEEGYGVALDIGTTTLAYSLVNLKTGEETDRFGVLNHQGAYGADVLSRIAAADQGKAQSLQESILSQTREALSRFRAKIPDGRVRKLTVCGNTTMLHFFMGADVSGIGRYPFTASFLDTQRFSGTRLNLEAEEVVLLPSLSAYFGADAVIGGVVVNLRKETSLLADIGTNGEMLLHVDKKMYAASTAAGPCFEGANIECGIGGVNGAIDSVFERDGKICYTVIGGGKAEGICGAGLVDAVALMLKKGIIDETGAFTAQEQRFYISDEIYISQADIRNFQLAKSAICAGMRALISAAGIQAHELKRVYIAGGLGFYLNLRNAVAVGLFPPELESKLTVVGNTALAGAKQCLCRRGTISQAEKIARETEYLDLAASDVFMDAYVENMYFGE